MTPEKWKRPEWERQDNSQKLFSTLLMKSLAFSELLEETGFSRSTLTNHLKHLQDIGVIEKAVIQRKVIYRTTANEDLILSEFKKTSFDFLMEFLSVLSPELNELIELYLKLAIKSIDLSKRRRVEGKKQVTVEDLKTDPLYKEIVNLGQKIKTQNQETQRFFAKYYDSGKKSFNKSFWETMKKISIKELQERKN